MMIHNAPANGSTRREGQAPIPQFNPDFYVVAQLLKEYKTPNTAGLTKPKA
jgi:hypothetical protein